jgi:hypothetical protein
MQYRSGELAWKLYPHQLVVYEMYRAFEQRVIAGLNDGPPIFVLDCARRWMKTYLVCLIKGEDCQRRPGSSHTFATAIESDIGEIIIPIFEDIYEECPEDCRPEYRTTRRGLNAGFYFPNGSILKLVGVDKKPRGMRGRWSDGFALTEAAFFAELVRPVSKILHQFQRRPWACMIMESSAPEDPEHDFDEVFVPDARRRSAYVFQTIDDNTQLSEDDKTKYYAEAAKVSVEEADRELYGKRSRGLGGVVIPEFDPAKHVREVPIPQHACAITADDPGLKHLNGLVLGLYDFDNARIIIQKSWAGLNAGPAHLAAATAAREHSLWGTWPDPRMKHIPLESNEYSLGWRDLLLNDEHANMAERLWELAQRPREGRPTFENTPGKFILQDIPDHLTYWDGIEHKPNPFGRVSDVELQLIRALSEHYGLEFSPTNKSDLHSMVNLARSWLAQGRVIFLPGAGPVIDHVQKGKWDKSRVKFAEHRTMGHYDCLASVIYLIRYVDQNIASVRPHPPASAQLERKRGQLVQERAPWEPKLPHELELERRVAAARGGGDAGRMRSWDAGRMKGWGR